MTDICLQMFNLFEYKRTRKFPIIMTDIERVEKYPIQYGIKTLDPHNKLLVVKK